MAKSGSTSDQDQWVMILPESIVKEKDDPIIFKIRHPKSGQGAMFMSTNGGKTVSEVLKFDEPCRSYFIGQTIQQDGSLILTTPVDPLFLVIPYLMKNKDGKFTPLDQQVCDDEFPQCHRLCECLHPKQLQCIADTKDPDDLLICKYNEEKTLDWLSKKVTKVADFLETKDSHSNSKRDDVVRYAHGIVSDYVSHELSDSLRNHMGIKIPTHEKPSIEEPPSKKQKTEPLEDYSNNNSLVKKDDKRGKTSAAQTKLNKVDKTGMKNISSFFTAKPKK